MSLPTLSAAEAARLIREQGALLVDVRGPDEHARARIPGALNLPLDQLDEAALAAHAGKPVLFHCRSGMRTTGTAPKLADCTEGMQAFIVEGGLDAWQRAGLPVEKNERRPIEVMRQVQIAAGSLALLGVLLGAFVAPGFYALSGFVGAGLIFAGVTGNCPMANMLRAMPWNRVAAAP
ncbi:rhodanese family protein [Rubritepida flocculans]|uniref:rhodanese family protein n=1 Tax=Rubritepida flocculans TaxID=182403 RepID=UPI00040223E7|nr:rhodanese family protein [Rubritepida flocculans]